MTALKEYNDKRNFESTKEPTGTSGKKGTKKLRFVVQRHHASRLHYDFRLEMDGVLKSWAIPKGPSLNPDDKRLAVMVEDHPLSYRTFEGEIPKGNYGFGTVRIFDKGYYTPLDKSLGEKELLQQLESGSLKIVLHGKKLKGEFALVRMKHAKDENAWLLIKHADKYAIKDSYDAEDEVNASEKAAGTLFRKQASRKAPSKKEQTVDVLESDSYMPMLATLASSVTDSDDWIFEQKLDGFRSIAHVSHKAVLLRSRNDKDFNQQFPSIVKDLQKTDRTVILDGEIVAEDAKGKTRFQLLQNGEPLPARYKLYYYVFDMLMLDDNDLRDFPLIERKDLLKRWLQRLDMPSIRLLEIVGTSEKDALEVAKENDWEGVMAKQTDSRYGSGKRSDSWRKLKLQQSQEAIIVGFTAPSGSRIGFGALVLAVLQDHKYQYIGNVGTGFSDEQLKNLTTEFKKIIVKKKPFDSSVKVANERKVTWMKPKLIAEINFAEWTADGHLRHPVFKALRSDKKLPEIKRVHPIIEIANERELIFGRKKLQLTNQKKMYWPEEGISKGDLVHYYEQVAALMLPFLKDKPISLNRFPNGIHEASFFQKDLDRNTGPNWLKTVSLTSESTGKSVNYLICNDIPTLLWIANMGSIEINPWLESYRKKTKPVFGVLDLDPNGADFKEVVAVANTAHEILNNAAIESFIKTSGSTGLHIYIHMGEQYSFDVVRDFLEMLAELIHEQHPDTTSLERAPNKRKNKIYLDYMQNKRAQTVVAPYSVRPKPNATVSTPLDWSEVNDELTIGQFTIKTVLDRIESKKDPWADIFAQKANLKKAINSF
ncbi:DNA ligase D [Sphingobacterium sp. lm-10]|uniref:DNA ligase D n=1 Tax=Sphingobacterium sp. lm-10 TaxID=2944904 RepID=UPI00202047D3|nr:DNA ligase D [Sphingobacterium sp. lm-10]MCL7987128.1 DNA ligase D [Sphingobacterium sp. lm-10]